ERELIEPVATPVTITPPPAPGSGFVSSLTLQTPKVNTIFGRFGLRAESSDTYLETGIEAIDSRGVLQSYTLPQSSGPIYCFPRVSPSNLLCGPDPSPNSPLDKHDIASLALTGNFSLPVP